MRLISLHLKQWRSYEDCRIEFPDGLVGVRGPNGAGKSTLAEAVGWALFGKLRSRAKIEHLRRQGAPPRARSSVELVFQLGTSLYRVERVVRGDARLWINDQLETTKTRDTNVRLAQELGVTKDVFWRTVFAEQKDVAALDPAARSEDRKSHVERLLGLEKYKQAATRARGDAKTLKAEIDGLRALAPDADEIHRKLEDAEREAAATDPEVKKAEDDCARVDAERKRLAAAVDAERERARYAEMAAAAATRAGELERNVARRRQAEQELAAVEPRLASRAPAEQALDTWDELRDALDDLDAARGDLKQIAYDPKARKDQERRVGTAREELDALRAARAGRAEEAEKAGARLDALRALADTGESAVHDQRLKAARKRARDLSNELAVRTEQLRRDRSHLKDVEEGGPDVPCSVCGKPYGDDYERLVESYRAAVAEAESMLPNLEVEHERAEESCRAAEAALAAARAAEAAVAKTSGARDVAHAERAERAARSALEADDTRSGVLSNEVQELERALRDSAATDDEWRALESDRKAAEKRVGKSLAALGEEKYAKAKHDRARTTVEQLQAVGDSAAELRAEIKTLAGAEAQRAKEASSRDEAQAKAAHAAATLEELKEKPGSLEPLKERLAQIEATRDAARERLNAAKLAAQARSHEVRRLKEELKHAERASAEIASRIDSMRAHEVAADLLSRYRDQQARRAWPRLESGASALLAAATDGRYADVELSEDYRLMIVDRGEKHELARFSGGEQDLANLCLRLAIADWVALDRDAELGFVVLDEVFGSQDDERRQRLIRELRGLAERFRQVLVITHLPDVADLCDSQIDVIISDSGLSTALLQ